MEPSQTTSNLMWYNYNPVEGIIASSTPVQVELGAVDIARQINQQVHLQYGSLQAVPTQPQQIIVTHQAAPEPSPPTPEPPPTPKPTIKSRQRSSNGERVPCGECGKTFSCNANLRDHMRLHTGERPFTCSECSMSFAQRSNWRLHKRVHTGERPYMCGICGKTFSRSSHLPGHMRVHTGERPFNCERCDNAFASAQALKNHMRTHTGEKPFVCEYCQTAFTHSSSLSSHKKRCTGEKRKRGRPLGSGRKPFKKKPTGRPRGRPKKKTRYARKGRRKNPTTGDDPVEPKSEEATAEVKSEVQGDSSEESNTPVVAKQEFDIPMVVVDSGSLQMESVELHKAEGLEGENQLAREEVVGNSHVLATGDIIPSQEVIMGTSTGLNDTSDLHQEAAVAMAALHEGTALNLAHHQLPQDGYADRDSSHIWYPKQTLY